MEHELTKTNIQPFQTLTEASKTTGLAVFFLRAGCRNGTIPCIKSGKKFLVNVPALLRKLDAESEGVSV